MGDLFLLTERQMARISPFFPLSHGVPRVDDRLVVSGNVCYGDGRPIILVLSEGQMSDHKGAGCVGTAC